MRVVFMMFDSISFSKQSFCRVVGACLRGSGTNILACTLFVACIRQAAGRG